MSEHRVEITGGVNEGRYAWDCACGVRSGNVYSSGEAARAAGEDHRTMTPSGT